MIINVNSVLAHLIFIAGLVAGSILVPAPTGELPVGRLIMTGWNGQNYEELLASTRRGDLGAIVIFSTAFENLPDLRQKIRRLRDAAPWPLVFAIDAEGGKVIRFAEGLGIPQTPTAFKLGLAGDAETYATAKAIATALKSADVDLNLAPVVDLLIEPANPAIGVLQRSYSADPAIVTARARQFIRAHKEVGLTVALKHFPGLGSAALDTHDEPVDVTHTWRASELEPYRQILKSGFGGAIMVAHLSHKDWDPELPASLSPHVIQQKLRSELSFDGVVITDDLQMQAIAAKYGMKEASRRALIAGNDWLMFTQQHRHDPPAELHRYLSELIRAGQVSRTRVEQSLKRIEKFSACALQTPCAETPASGQDQPR